jgi:hypothetical protein
VSCLLLLPWAAAGLSRRLLFYFSFHNTPVQFRGEESSTFMRHTIPPTVSVRKNRVMHKKTLPIPKEKQKLLSRIKRLGGQMDAVERAVTEEDECDADISMLLAKRFEVA